MIKPHPEIHISPLCGDILGLQTTSIDFMYNPRTHATADCEIEIRTTEFDSQPKVIRIVGNAAPLSGPPKHTDIGGSAYGSVGGGTFQKGLNVIYEEDQASHLRGEANQPKTLL